MRLETILLRLYYIRHTISDMISVPLPVILLLWLEGRECFPKLLSIFLFLLW
jgi:hypothetical protein